jgi:hypothetical protein
MTGSVIIKYTIDSRASCLVWHICLGVGALSAQYFPHTKRFACAERFPADLMIFLLFLCYDRDAMRGMEHEICVRWL